MTEDMLSNQGEDGVVLVVLVPDHGPAGSEGRRVEDIGLRAVDVSVGPPVVDGTLDIRHGALGVASFPVPVHRGVVSQSISPSEIAVSAHLERIGLDARRESEGNFSLGDGDSTGPDDVEVLVD